MPFSYTELKDIIVAFDKIKAFFNDEEKARLWWETKNPLLGNISPAQLAVWRSDKLLKFIETSLDQGKTS